MLEHAYEPSSWLPYLLIGSNLIASLAWPLAVVAVVLIFKHQIRELIPKIENLTGPGGMSIGLKRVQGAGLADEEPIKQTLEKLSPNVLRTQPLEKLEDSLRAELETLEVPQRIPVLLTALAQTRLESAFNLAYANIFGSQIRALRLLNDRGGKIDRASAEKEFAELKANTPAIQDWSLDLYLQFLRHYLFIDEVSGEFILTDFGREFLAYLSRRGLSDDRIN
jgi:hypothetical protein